MKKQLFTFLLVLTTISSIAQDSLKLQNIDQLGEAVFFSFQTADLELFESLLLSESKFEFILNNLDAEDSTKQIFRKQGKGAVFHLRSQSKENFNHVLSISEELNLDWEKAQIVKILEESRSQIGIKRSDISIRIKSEGKTYVLFLPGCHKTDTWCVANKVRLSKF
ncbi:hypothetical protein [Brumimicrobium mesophilum]|uniref:hypothetical protein n=1 Tax=Brumimicrobium mesophilum TaxID=392717 RepID=UPI000D1448BB|nr:hypothetical protein [Brumimicrobium mesophilum]